MGGCHPLPKIDGWPATRATRSYGDTVLYLILFMTPLDHETIVRVFLCYFHLSIFLSIKLSIGSKAKLTIPTYLLSPNNFDYLPRNLSKNTFYLDSEIKL